MKVKLYKRVLRHIWLVDLKLEMIRIVQLVIKLVSDKSFRQMYRRNGYVLFSSSHLADCMFRWKRTEMVRFARIWNRVSKSKGNDSFFEIDSFKKRYESYSRRYWSNSAKLMRAIENAK